MLSEDIEKQENISRSKNYLPKYMIARLKFKCSVTLISLLEARKDNEIVLRMMKSLNLDIIKRNIIDIYHLYEEVGNKKYCPDIFMHFKDKPDEDNPE
jgi:hypothetical protein